MLQSRIRKLFARAALGFALAGVFGFQMVQAPIHEACHRIEAQTQKDHGKTRALSAGMPCSVCALGQLRSHTTSCTHSPQFIRLEETLQALPLPASPSRAFVRLAEARAPPFLNVSI